MKFSSHYNKIIEYQSSDIDPQGRSGEDALVIDDIDVSINPYLDSLRLSPIIDPRLSSILSTKRELEINNKTIVRIQNDFTFFYKEENFSDLRNFYLSLKDNKITPPNGFEAIDFNSIKVYKTQITLNGETVSEITDGKSFLNGRVKDEYTCDVRSSNDLWRIYGRAYTIWSFVYASAGLETNSQTKRRKCKFLSGCWYSWDVPVNIPTLKLKYDIWVATYAPLARYTETRIASNGNWVSHFIGEAGGIGVPAFSLSGWYCTNGTHPTYGARECSRTFINAPSLALTTLTCP